MDKYICNNCNRTFNMTNSFDMSDSDLIRLLTLKCPHCGSYEFHLTEHGKLLYDRQKKIEKLNEIND